MSEVRDYLTPEEFDLLTYCVKEAKKLRNNLNITIHSVLNESKLNDTFTIPFENYIVEADELIIEINDFIKKIEWIVDTAEGQEWVLANQRFFNNTGLRDLSRRGYEVINNLKRSAVEGQGFRRARKRRRSVKRKKRKQCRKN